MAGTDRGNTSQGAAHIVSAVAGVVVFLALWLGFSMNAVLSFILGLVTGVVVFLILTRRQPGGGGQLPSATKPPSATVPPATASPVSSPLSGITKEAGRKPVPATDEAPGTAGAGVSETPGPQDAAGQASGSRAQAPATPAPEAPEAAAPAAPELQPAPAPEAAAPAPAPAAQMPDDLKRISGIGPVIEKKLNAMGVQHFHQIATWNEADAARVDEQLNFRGRIAREKWIEQARALVDSAAQN